MLWERVAAPNTDTEQQAHETRASKLVSQSPAGKTGKKKKIDETNKRPAEEMLEEMMGCNYCGAELSRKQRRCQTNYAKKEIKRGRESRIYTFTESRRSLWQSREAFRSTELR